MAPAARVLAPTASLLVALLVLVGSQFASDPVYTTPGHGNATDAERLQGDWVLAETIAPNGAVIKHRAGQPDTSHFNIYFEKGRAIFHFDGTDPEDEIISTFTVAPMKKPKEIDFTGTFSTITNFKKGQTTLGIYQLDGNTLTLCLADEGWKTRPPGFKSSPPAVQVGKRMTLYRLIRSEKPISQDSGVAGYRPKR